MKKFKILKKIHHISHNHNGQNAYPMNFELELDNCASLLENKFYEDTGSEQKRLIELIHSVDPPVNERSMTEKSSI